MRSMRRENGLHEIRGERETRLHENNEEGKYSFDGIGEEGENRIHEIDIRWREGN